MKTMIIAASLTLAIASSAQAQQVPTNTFYNVFLSQSTPFTIEKASSHAHMNGPSIENALGAGRTVRVCKDGPFGTPTHVCQYVVPAEPVAHTHTVYSNQKDVGSFRWRLWHPDPALYLNQGIAFRVCPMQLVNAPTTKPTCRTWLPS